MPFAIRVPALLGSISGDYAVEAAGACADRGGEAEFGSGREGLQRGGGVLGPGTRGTRGCPKLEGHATDVIGHSEVDLDVTTREGRQGGELNRRCSRGGGG